ncbi:33111_t:CDS:2, partial [Gigaspora margarita]
QVLKKKIEEQYESREVAMTRSLEESNLEPLFISLISTAKSRISLAEFSTPRDTKTSPKMLQAH